MALDFIPDWRSVYFQSLESYPGYEDIYNQGQIALGNVFGNTIENRWLNNERFETALKILKNGITLEKNAEKQYINTLLSNPLLNDKLLIDYKKKFIDIFSNDNIDYIEFINLLNEILLGVDNYQSIVKLEQKRLKELNTAMERLKEEELKKEIELNKKRKNVKTEQQLKIEIDKELRNTYLQQHGYSESKFKEYFQDITPTIDNILADYATKACNKILTSKEFLNEFSQQWKLSKSNDELIPSILKSILRQINTQIPQIVKEIINDSKYDKISDTIITELIKNATNNIETMALESEQLFQRGQFTGIKINDKKEIETKGEKLAEQLLNVYLVAEENSTLKNLLKQHVNKRKKNSVTIEYLLGKLDEAITQLQDAEKKQNQSSQDIKDKKRHITNLKYQISNATHKQLKKMLNNATSEQAKKDIMHSLQESFNKTSIKINGPAFSEVIDKFIQNNNLFSQTYWSGAKNQKADTITIAIDSEPFHTEINSANVETDIIQKEIDNLIKKGMDNFYTTFTDNIHDNLGFSLERGAQAWYKAVDENYKKLVTEINKNNENETETAKKLQKLAIEIKNTIVITTTMKTFNQYNNNIGFIGGTLGSTIGAQLDNIQTLFTAAGVGLSNAELNSLEVLLINCSDSTLGASNRPALEKFLSTLTAFAVFNEGSAEVQMISDSIINNYVSTSPKLMHLYKLNGLYYPGSFILQRIYDNLQTTTHIIEQEEKNTDGVQIRATASEKLIGSHYKTQGIERWAKVYQAASDSSITSINVTFLSNLINILGQLEKAFNI